MLFRKRHAEQAEIGILLPGDQAPAARLVRIALARFELIVVGEVALAGLFQELLFFGKLKVHLVGASLAALHPLVPAQAGIQQLDSRLRGNERRMSAKQNCHSPKIALAMICF